LAKEKPEANQRRKPFPAQGLLPGNAQQKGVTDSQRAGNKGQK
jgi:hypothetical protein